MKLLYSSVVSIQFFEWDNNLEPLDTPGSDNTSRPFSAPSYAVEREPDPHIPGPTSAYFVPWAREEGVAVQVLSLRKLVRQLSLKEKNSNI